MKNCEVFAVGRLLPYICLPNITARGGEVVSRWAHNPKIVGSNPAPATKSRLYVGFFLPFFTDLHHSFSSYLNIVIYQVVLALIEPKGVRRVWPCKIWLDIFLFKDI